MGRLTTHTTVLVLLLLLLALVSPFPAHAQERQDANQARLGENELEQLLRRFGPEAAALKEKIETSITTGADWLLSMQKDDGSFDCRDKYPFGGTALCALAILKSAVGLYEGSERDLKKDIRKLERRARSRHGLSWIQQQYLDHLREHGEAEVARRAKLLAAVDKAIEWIRATYDEICGKPHIRIPAIPAQKQPNLRTYGVGVLLMLLEARYTEKDVRDDGTYVHAVNARAIPPAVLDWVRELVKWMAQNIIDAKGPDGNPDYPGKAWRYPAGHKTGNTDLSCTQYAVLGLKAGSRMGVHAEPAELWTELVTYLLATQEAQGPVVPRKPVAQDPSSGGYFFPPQKTDSPEVDRARGWRYQPGWTAEQRGTGSMTTAGLAALIIAKSELVTKELLTPRLEQRIDAAINDGVAWLGANFTVTRNPNSGGWHYYYLYGLERAGVLAQTEHFLEHAWYVKGAEFLVSQQGAEGKWTTGEAELENTAFAILFLKRATVPVQVPLRVPRPVVTGTGSEDE